VLLQQAFRRRHQLQGLELEPLGLKPTNDVAHHTTLHTVGLDHAALQEGKRVNGATNKIDAIG